MANGHARSAITGRYISRAAAGRHPRTSFVESGGNKGSGKAYRSAISGKLARLFRYIQTHRDTDHESDWAPGLTRSQVTRQGRTARRLMMVAPPAP